METGSALGAGGAESEKAAAGPGRLGALDVCRGLAILAVVFIHVSGHFLPALHPVKSHAPPSWAWYALAVPNAGAQWAVPCFLMLSAFVNALSLARGNDVARYARRRAQTAVLPYLLWSGVYILVDTLNAHRPFPGPLHVAKLLLTGTAHFHLYFFVLVIELYVLLPLLVPLLRRPPFWAVAAAGVAAQAAVYGLNRFVFPHRFQTTIFWDILPVLLGLWLWSQASRWPEVFRRGRWAAGGVSLLALCVYTPLAVATLLPPAHINTAVYQFSQWAYTAGMSFLMLAGAGALGHSRLTALLTCLGAESLAIYVMHPLAIILLDHLGLNRAAGAGLGVAVYSGVCLGLPLAAAWAWRQGKAAVTRSRPPE